MRFDQIQPPHGLEETIIARVIALRERSRSTRRIVFSSLSVASFVLLALIGSHLYTALSASGFFGYAALGISDPSTLSVFARELALSLVESIPGASLALFLAVIVAFLWSLARALSTRKRVVLAS